jgi:hypothetical protein
MIALTATEWLSSAIVAPALSCADSSPRSSAAGKTPMHIRWTWRRAFSFTDVTRQASTANRAAPVNRAGQSAPLVVTGVIVRSDFAGPNLGPSNPGAKATEIWGSLRGSREFQVHISLTKSHGRTMCQYPNSNSVSNRSRLAMPHTRAEFPAQGHIPTTGNKACVRWVHCVAIHATEEGI